MSRSRTLARTLPALLWLAVALAGGRPLLEPSAPPAPTPELAMPAMASAYVPPAAAIEALRAGDCDGALAATGSDTVEARTVAALYAHACGAHAAAFSRLRVSTDDPGPLADWRLWALGRSAAELGQPEAAQRAFEELAERYPDSPLADFATASAAELALERDDLAAVGRLVERGRGRDLEPEPALRVETVAWRAATAGGEPLELRRAASRLLVRHPLAAAELGAIEVFRQQDGSLDWAAILDAESLRLRARGLLDAGLAPSAVETLDQVAVADRGAEWTLLRAEALVEARLGSDALALLADLTGSTPEREARLEWWRARAAVEASTARSGRTANAARRREIRQTAHDHLRRVVALATDADLTRQALRRLFADLADAGRFDEAIEALRALREIDPTDETGAGYLWRRGWRELERRNHSSAIGYWAELRQLYPDSTSARRALYWSARAHQKLGNEDRSQALLHQVVASPQADFYHRHAMEWLVEPPPRATPSVAPAAWPLDPLLERARWLSDAGLDGPARLELELLAADADPRAARALLAQILARQGEIRSSIVELRRAFPDLGTHRQGRAPKTALHLYYPVEFDGLVHEAARRHELSPHLVFAMIRQESAFDSSAHSHAGARGLMQVMPATGRELAGRLGLSYHRQRLVEPGFSVQLGTAYYRQVLRSFGDEELALAGYNGGPSRIRRWWRRSGDWSEMDRFIEGLPLNETRTYVQRIVLLSNAYRDLYAG